MNSLLHQTSLPTHLLVFPECVSGTFLCLEDSVLKVLLALFSNSTLQSCLPDPTQLLKQKHAVLKSRTRKTTSSPHSPPGLSPLFISQLLQAMLPLIITALQVLPILLTANPGDANLSSLKDLQSPMEEYQPHKLFHHTSVIPVIISILFSIAHSCSWTSIPTICMEKESLLS